MNYPLTPHAPIDIVVQDAAGLPHDHTHARVRPAHPLQRQLVLCGEMGRRENERGGVRGERERREGEGGREREKVGERE